MSQEDIEVIRVQRDSLLEALKRLLGATDKVLHDPKHEISPEARDEVNKASLQAKVLVLTTKKV